MVKKRKRIDPVQLALAGMLAAFAVTCLYPIYYEIVASLSNPAKVAATSFLFVPLDFGLNVYSMLLNYQIVWTGYKNSLIYLALGTSLSVMTTMMGAYALSRPNLWGKKVVLFLIILTMYISGGMIPTFLVVTSIGMYNTIWANIIPSMIGVWNLLIARAFLVGNIPNELHEAAVIDGAGEVRIFATIVLPLSKAIIAVLILYYGSGIWNSFFNALIYLKDRSLFPLQLVLREILIQDRVAMDMGGDTTSSEFFWKEGIKYGVTVVSIAPLLILFPFAQRYFVKGVMIGSLKD